jgi:hypothetical protein
MSGSSDLARIGEGGTNTADGKAPEHANVIARGERWHVQTAVASEEHGDAMVLAGGRSYRRRALLGRISGHPARPGS